MKGLLLKDFIYVRRLYLKVILMLIGFYFILGLLAAEDGSSADTYTLSSALTVILSVLPVSTFTLDNAAHWERYALSGPVDRRMMVLSKYLFSWLAILFGMLLSLLYAGVVVLLKGVPDSAILSQVLAAIPAFGCVGLFLISTQLPCIYRFGPEKARILLFLLVCIPFAGFLVWRSLHLPALPSGALQALAVVLPLLVIVGAYASYRLSLHIFSHKEID